MGYDGVFSLFRQVIANSSHLFGTWCMMESHLLQSSLSKNRNSAGSIISGSSFATKIVTHEWEHFNSFLHNDAQMFSNKDKMKVPIGTCAMYPLVLNQWERLIRCQWILSLLWRRGFPPSGEDKVDPSTTLHHLKSHFSYLVQQLIASSFVVSHFLGFENCLLVVYSNFDDASCFFLALIRRTHLWMTCHVVRSQFQFVVEEERKWFSWWPTALKTLSSRSLSSLQEEKLFLSTFVSLFENELQLEPTWVRFCRFLDCLFDSAGG